ncbi:MAG: terminase, partial [Candidatus Nanopelagicales bacterium]
MVTHTFAPRGVIRTLFEDRSPEILCSGPAGTGKSRGCLEKVHLAMLRYPGASALLVRQTAVSLTSTGLDTWRRFVIPEADGT